jgi:hypothetical protein
MGTTTATPEPRESERISASSASRNVGDRRRLKLHPGFEKGETTMERSRAGVKGSRNIRDGWIASSRGPASATASPDTTAGFRSRPGDAADCGPFENELQLDVGLSWNEDRPVVGPRDAYPGGYFQTGFTHNWTPSSKFQHAAAVCPQFR